MTVYSCEPNWDAMLTCIYEAWSSKKGHQNIQLMLEPIEQLSLLNEYTHVDTDPAKVESVIDAINFKISPYFYQELAFTSMSSEPDVLDNLYRVMILGFHYGPGILNSLQYRDIMRNREIRIRLGHEQCHFIDFVRFHEIPGNIYVAHIEPKSRLVASLGPHFSDRMPSENWMIVDDIHKEAVVHPKNAAYYIRTLTDNELNSLLLTEKENDQFTDLWKTFYDSIAIEERSNDKCRMNHFPIWTRKHAVEFL